MASQAFAGVGTKFQRWSGSVWEDIAEVNAIEGPGMTKDTIEVTSIDTDAGYNEFITGFAEGGTVTLDMNFTRETYEIMKDDFESDAVRDYRIQLADFDSEPSTFTFGGLVIELPMGISADDKVTADVVIQVTSQVVLDIGSTVPAEESETGEEGYDSELETYWTGLSTPLITAQKDRLQTLITALKTGLGITSLTEKFDVMYMFANQTMEAAMRNIVKRAHDCVDPSSADYGIPDFEAYRGVYSTWNLFEHLDTNYDQARDFDNAAITDCAYGIYCTDEKAPAGATYAWGSGPNNGIILNYSTGNVVRGNVNGINATTTFMAVASVGYAQGMTITGRSGNNVYWQKNGGLWEGKAATAGAGYGNTVLILATRDAAGNVIGATNNQMGFFFISSNLNQAQADVITEAVEAYMESVGAGEISSAL